MVIVKDFRKFFVGHFDDVKFSKTKLREKSNINYTYFRKIVQKNVNENNLWSLFLFFKKFKNYSIFE